MLCCNRTRVSLSMALHYIEGIVPALPSNASYCLPSLILLLPSENLTHRSISKPQSILIPNNAPNTASFLHSVLHTSVSLPAVLTFDRHSGPQMGGIFTNLDGQNARLGRLGCQVCERKQATRYAFKNILTTPCFISMCLFEQTIGYLHQRIELSIDDRSSCADRSQSFAYQ